MVQTANRQMLDARTCFITLVIRFSLVVLTRQSSFLIFHSSIADDIQSWQLRATLLSRKPIK